MRQLNPPNFGGNLIVDVPDDLLARVADQIEMEPDRYHQGLWNYYEPCGTVHCIGGWAIALVGLRLADDASAPRLTAELLGLSYDAADCLTNMEWKPRADLSVPEALRQLQKTRDNERRTLELDDVLEVSHLRRYP